MSIQSIQSRIAEINGRLSALSVHPTDDSEAPFVLPRAKPTGSMFGNSMKPFDVALAAALGQAGVKPPTAPLAMELPDRIEAMVQKYSAMNGLDPKLVRAIIKVESDGNPTTVSSKGAMGLMQLMPEELAMYGVNNAFDPEQNIMGGTRQLADKLRTFGGNLDLALAAYNAGEGNVRKYHGVPPFPETQRYIAKIHDLIDQ